MKNAHRSPCLYLLAIWSIVFLSLTACARVVDTSATSNSNEPPAAHPVLPIQEKRVTIAGSQQFILTDARGFALYFYVPDTAQKSACTGNCAIAWPPLLSNGSADITGTSSLPGKLTTQQAGNGNQVEYNKHLLYTYVGDSTPGQVTGNGLNSWYVATPDLAAPTS